MNSQTDKLFLVLQFKNKICSKMGIEFQSFFEEIMQESCPNFEKVPSAGGDGGNDGWIRKLGRYYQVYAPQEPSIKDSVVAEKFKKDFQKLQNHWNSIKEIKEYYFVFNDKYEGGSRQKTETVISELETENPSVKFRMFLAKDLENLFSELDNSSLSKLGFNVSQTTAIEHAYLYLEFIKIDLDREVAGVAQRKLKDFKNITLDLDDKNLSLEYELLECKCLKNLEKTDEAKEKYKNISIKFPDDIHSFLSLAEIYVKENKLDKNKEYIEKANNIDQHHWLLQPQRLLRKIFLPEEISIEDIENIVCPSNLKEKSICYALCAAFYDKLGDQTKANSFIEKAIDFNPDRLNNYIVKFSFSVDELSLYQVDSKILEKSQELLEEIKKIETEFSKDGDINLRSKSNLNVLKLKIFLIQKKFLLSKNLAQETLKLSISCYFNIEIENILIKLLEFLNLSDGDFKQLLEYLKKSKKKISSRLLNLIFFQFNIRDSLFIDGIFFFEEIGNEKYCSLINEIINKNYNKVLELLKPDPQLATIIASTSKDYFLSKKIIDNLPDNANIQKEKIQLLQLISSNDEKKYDEILNILSRLTLSELNYYECHQVLKIIYKKEAWDFAGVILLKLIKEEKDKKSKFNLNYNLFSSYFRLKKYKEAVQLGEKLLKENSIDTFLDEKNTEILLRNTIIVCLERGVIDKNYDKQAKTILEKNTLEKTSFEFKVEIETQVYLKNNEAKKALQSIVEGIRIKKVLSSNEYANLWFPSILEIVNKLKLDWNSLNQISENTFIKFKNEDLWYFIGEGNALDSIPILKTSNKYNLLIDKKIGEKIIFENPFNPENRENFVEKIFTIEKYICHQVVRNFYKLAESDNISNVKLINVIDEKGNFDFKILEKFIHNKNKKSADFFENDYSKTALPLAMLAVSQGGIFNAIGHIYKENKGFVHFCLNSEDFENQKKIAQKVIAEKIPFYIDGTSALFLSEIGLLQKIYPHLPNFKIPQSVISLLIGAAKRLDIQDGEIVSIRSSQGKVGVFPINEENRSFIQSNFIASIKILESKPEYISDISSVNKIDCSSEKNMFAELCDACILAQKEDLPILTEDLAYLIWNQAETKKRIPEYFSSLSLVRILYENGYLSFDDYLDYFSYLSSYRFRFLTFSLQDIEKAVLGDRNIAVVHPENISKFNLPLLLSKEYQGIFGQALGILIAFLLTVIKDNSILVEIAEKIFNEILDALPSEIDKSKYFPQEIDKKYIGEILLDFCCREIKKNQPEFIFMPKNPQMEMKIKKLYQIAKIYKGIKL